MGESIQGGDQHNQRLDDDMGREPAAEEETPDPKLWDAPGHDGIVTQAETDPDRVDLRSQVGGYVSLVRFPARGRDLVAMAKSRNASDDVLAALGRLNPDERFMHTADVWVTLGLSSGHRT
jgi:hypothetical protein